MVGNKLYVVGGTDSQRAVMSSECLDLGEKIHFRFKNRKPETGSTNVGFGFSLKIDPRASYIFINRDLRMCAQRYLTALP